MDHGAVVALSSSRTLVLLGLAAALVASVPGAAAQDPQEPYYQVSVRAEPVAATITEALGSATFEITFSANPQGSAPPLTGQVLIDFTIESRSPAAPAGWSDVTIEPTLVEGVPPGEERSVNVTVRLTSTDVDAASYGMVVRVTSNPRATAGAALTVPNVQDSHFADATLTATRQLTTAESITAFANQNRFWLLGVAGVILVGGFLLVRRKKGLHVYCEQPSQPLIPGRGASFPVRIYNPGASKDILSLRTTSVPEGWSVLVPIDQIELPGGQGDTIWVTIKSPPNAVSGQRVSVELLVASTITPAREGSVSLEAVVQQGFELPVAEPKVR